MKVSDLIQILRYYDIKMDEGQLRRILNDNWKLPMKATPIHTPSIWSIKAPPQDTGNIRGWEGSTLPASIPSDLFVDCVELLNSIQK